MVRIQEEDSCFVSRNLFSLRGNILRNQVAFRAWVKKAHALFRETPTVYLLS